MLAAACAVGVAGTFAAPIGGKYMNIIISFCSWFCTFKCLSRYPVFDNPKLSPFKPVTRTNLFT